jgi:hypothetical protein
MTVKRWTLAAGTAGLVGGVALGVTGFASAANPTPSPSPGIDGRHGGPPMGKGFDRGFGKGMDRGGELGRGSGGLVSAVSADSLTVRTPFGTRTIGLTSSTAYYSGQTKATKAILSVGDVVGVRLADPKAAAPVAAVVTVLPAHLAGFVTKVDGSTITIVDASGFTRMIRTSSTTTYEKDGVAAKAAAVTVGTLVRAVGAVDADGTTLDATRVSIGTPLGKAGRRMGGPAGAPVGPTA